MIIIIINKYYCSAIKSKKSQEHLTTEKNKTNDSITHVRNRNQTVRDQTSSWRAVFLAVVWNISDGDVHEVRWQMQAAETPKSPKSVISYVLNADSGR